MMDNEVPDHPVPSPVPPLPADPDRESRAHVRERILRRFELWLDEILDSEQPPEGIAAEILEQLESETPVEVSDAGPTACDAYAMWSAVTTMAEETRLQGRAFKQLHDGLTPMQELVGSVDAMLKRHETVLDRQEQEIDETSRQAAWSDILGTLIDMRDRLLRGAQSAEAWLERPPTAPPTGLLAGFRARFRGRPDEERTQQQQEAVRSMLTGYNLCREVLDEALVKIDVRPMDCLGRPFDPLTMKAVDIAYDSDAPDGAVLEVFRQGYWRRETVCRPAEVKVARQRQDGTELQGIASPQRGQHE